MTRKKTLAFGCILVVGFGGLLVYLFYPEPPLDPVQMREIDRVTAHLRSNLPDGWSVATKREVISVRRTEPVDFLPTVALPTTDHEGYKNFCRKNQLEITVRVCPRIGPSDYDRMVRENQQTARAIEEFVRTKLSHIPASKPTDSSDRSTYFRPETPEDKALLADFRSFIKSLPHRELPNFYTEECSIYMKTSMVGWTMVFYSEQNADCLNVWDIIASLFKPHPDTENPFKWRTGFGEKVGG